MNFFKGFFTGVSSEDASSPLERHWTFYTAWLQRKLPQYYSYLNPSTSEEQIATLKSQLPFTLPEELLQLYRLNNGDKSDEQELPVGTFMQFDYQLEFLGRLNVNWKERQKENQKAIAMQFHFNDYQGQRQSHLIEPLGNGFLYDEAIEKLNEKYPES